MQECFSLVIFEQWLLIEKVGVKLSIQNMDTHLIPVLVLDHSYDPLATSSSSLFTGLILGG
jgi:hypothetical protein